MQASDTARHASLLVCKSIYIHMRVVCVRVCVCVCVCREGKKFLEWEVLDEPHSSPFNGTLLAVLPQSHRRMQLPASLLLLEPPPRAREGPVDIPIFLGMRSAPEGSGSTRNCSWDRSKRWAIPCTKVVMSGMRSLRMVPWDGIPNAYLGGGMEKGEHTGRRQEVVVVAVVVMVREPQTNPGEATSRTLAPLPPRETIP